MRSSKIRSAAKTAPSRMLTAVQTAKCASPPFASSVDVETNRVRTSGQGKALRGPARETCFASSCRSSERTLSWALRRRRCGLGAFAFLASWLLVSRGDVARSARRRRGRLGDGRRRRGNLLVAEHLRELLALERLLGHEPFDDLVELLATRGQQFPGATVTTIDDVVDFLVDLLGGLLGVVALLGDLPAQEDQLVAAAERERPEPFAHAVPHHHLARHVRGLLDVVRGAGRGVARGELLGGPAAESHGNIVLELLLAPQVFVLLRKRPRHTAGHAAGDDRDLVDRIAVRKKVTDQSVPALVVRDHPLFLFRDDTRAALRSECHFLQGFLEFGVVDRLLAPPRGQDRGLVHHVGQIGAGEAWRDLRDLHQVDVLVERLSLDVHVKDGFAATNVWSIEHDLPIEPARPQQRRVQNVGPVRGGDDDDVRAGVEAVHLDEDLVQGLLALVVRTAEAGATLAADRVDLVDEDDAWRVALGLVEEVAHAGRADADEHLHELRAGDREERNAGFSCDGAREQGLSRARRPYEQHATRDSRAQSRELFRVFQELDHFGQLLLGLVDAGDVVESHGRLVPHEHAGAGLPEGERLVIRALRLPHHVQEEAGDEDDRKDRDQQLAQPLEGLALHDGPVSDLLVGRGVRSVVVRHELVEVVRAGDGGLLLLAVLQLDLGGVAANHRLDGFDLSLLDLLDGLRVVDGVGRRLLLAVGVEGRDAHDHEKERHDAVLEDAVVETRGSALPFPTQG